MWYIRGHQMQHSHHALRLRAELIVLATVFFIAWNKIDIQRSLVVSHRISHFSLVVS